MSISNCKLVSIIVPCYNSVRYIQHAVESACNQDYANYEVVVVDNASTDGTTELLRKLLNKLNFRLYINEENLGAIVNFNNAIEYSNGDFIKFLESDDILEENCLSIMMKYVTDNANIVCGAKTLIDENSNIIGFHDVSHKLVDGKKLLKKFRRSGNIIGTPTDCLVLKDLLDKVGGFSNKYGDYLNDLDVWLKICNEHENIQFISNRICKVRRHSQQMGAVGGQSLADVVVAFKMLDEDYFEGQKYMMRIHFGSAFFYRSLRQGLNGNLSALLQSFSFLQRELGLTIIFAVFYLPVYIYYLLKSKK